MGIFLAINNGSGLKRALVQCLSLLIAYGPAMRTLAGTTKDASEVAQEAQQFAEQNLILNTPSVTNEDGKLTIGIADENGFVSPVTKTPIDYRDLAPNGHNPAANNIYPQGESPDANDAQEVWNDGDAMDSAGAEYKAKLFQDAMSSNPSVVGSAYGVLIDTFNQTRSDTTQDPVWETTREVFDNLDEITSDFADCETTTSYTDTQRNERITDLKTCTKIFDRSETCTITHNFDTIGVLEYTQGQQDITYLGDNTIQVWLGVSGYLPGGSCTEYHHSTEFRVLNPEAIVKATLIKVVHDDFYRIFVDGTKVDFGPGSVDNYKTTNCDVSNLYVKHPHKDITSYFKSKQPGDLIEIRMDSAVAGNGEAEAYFEIEYDPTGIVTGETWTPDSCLEHLASASAGFATASYQVTSALNGAVSSGEVKGTPVGDPDTPPDIDPPSFCDGGTITYECPVDVEHPFTLQPDGTCSHSIIQEQPAIEDELVGCVDPTFVLNPVTGVCQRKDDLVVVPYQDVINISCPDDGNSWTYDSSTNTCSATITDVEPAASDVVKGCTNPDYEYHADTDTCNLPGVDVIPPDPAPVYSCPLDADFPWSLQGDRCTRTGPVTVNAIENSSWQCPTAGYTYNAYTKVCEIVEYSFAVKDVDGNCPVGYEDIGVECRIATLLTESAFSETTYTCSAGYSLDDSQLPPVCSGVEFFTIAATLVSEFTCDTGYVPDPEAGGCVPYSGQSADYTAVDQYVCPDDPDNPWTLFGSTCMRTYYGSVPANQLENWVCPDGFNWDEADGRCERQIVERHPYDTNGVDVCPDDPLNPWTLVGHECHRDIVETLDATFVEVRGCVADWIYDPDADNCFQDNVDVIPYAGTFHYECPTDLSNPWTLSGSTCTRTERTTVQSTVEPQYTCPIGYSLDSVSQTCTKITITDQPHEAEIEYTCGPGYTLVNGNQCTRTYTDSVLASGYPLYGCALGWSYVPANNTCTRTTTEYQPYTSTNVYSCPIGWTPSGTQCTRTVTNTQPASVSYSCPIGWIPSGTSCTKSTTVTQAATPNYSCPTGWSPVTGNPSNCRKVTSITPYKLEVMCKNFDASYGLVALLDYSKTIETGQCQYPWFSSWYTIGALGSGRSDLYNCVGSGTQICLVTDVNWSPPCPSGYTLNGSSCEKEDFQPAAVEYSCPIDYVLSGTTCSKTTVSTQPATPNYSCSIGWSLSGQTCSQTVTESQPATVTVVNSCPSGWINTGSQCSRTVTDTVDATQTGTGYSCSADRTLNMAPVPPTCDKQITETIAANQETNYSCLPGWVDMGSFCRLTVTDVITATYTGDLYLCPIGYTPDESVIPWDCWKDNIVNIPANLVADPNCPADYTDTGSDCRKIIRSFQPSSVINTYYTCPGDYTLDMSSAPPSCSIISGQEVIPAEISTELSCEAPWLDSSFDCYLVTEEYADRYLDGYIYSCDTGFILDSATPPPHCEGLVTENTDPILVHINTCPAGWIDTGTHCISQPPSVVPSEVLSSTPICDAGGVLDAEIDPATCTYIVEATRTAIETIEHTCPNDMVDTGMQCETFTLVEMPSQVIDLTYRCPVGWQLQSTPEPKCTRLATETVQATKGCDMSAQSTLQSFQQQSFPQQQAAALYVVPPGLPPAGNLGADGEDDCFFYIQGGVQLCESNFLPPPVPADYDISPFALTVEVQVDYDFYKGTFCYTDAAGDEQCVESGTSSEDTCDELANNPQCGYIKERCVEGAYGHDGVCYVSEVTYDCGEIVAVDDVDATTDFVCAGPVRCMGSDCFQPNKQQSQSFSKAAAMLNAAQFMGQDLSCVQNTDTGQLECSVFAGADYSCKTAVGGVQDCCDVPTNVGPGTYLQAAMQVAKLHQSIMGLQTTSGTVVSGYQSMANSVGSAVSQVTKPFASYIDSMSGAVDSVVQPVDALIDEMIAEIKQYMIDTINEMVGQAGADMAADAATSELASQGAEQYAETAGESLVNTASSVFGYVMAAYTIYVVAVMVIQMVYKCETPEFELAAKKDTGSCTYLGSYCADEALGACLEKRKSYCCYSSPLARIITEQAYDQLDLKMDVENPACPGLTVAQLEEIDWTSIDLGEWTAMLTKYDLNKEVNAADLSLESLTGSGNVYSEVFPDANRQDAGARAESRMEGIDLNQTKQDARQGGSVDLDGCSTCQN